MDKGISDGGVYMSLEQQIKQQRKRVKADGYDMSLGELVNLYVENELVITPDFQRLFRWTDRQQARFIESILLAIPIPPVFVFQDEDGVWELVDGLQRLSTVFRFVGVLRDNEGKTLSPSVLEGGLLLPALDGLRWETNDRGVSSIGRAQQIFIKRARLRVEILRPGSDEDVKYELFQRLNAGGSILTPQEIRTCMAVRVDRSFHAWLRECADFPAFKKAVDLSSRACERQDDIELIIRFMSFTSVPYDRKLDVHEYLNDALYTMAKRDKSWRGVQRELFERTFTLLIECLGAKSFRKWNARTRRLEGRFLQSAYEVVSTGVAANIDEISALSLKDAREFLKTKRREIWSAEWFNKSSGAGVRGTTRLANLLPIAKEYFKP
jgi:hypothetical protein